jgi:hypothetical protein
MNVSTNNEYKNFVNKFINKNYTKIKNLSYKYAKIYNNECFADDLISEFYIHLLERENRHKTVKDLEKTMAYFFKCLYFNNSALNKLSQKNIDFVDLTMTETEVEDPEKINDEIEQKNNEIENKLKEVYGKVNKLPPAYKQLFKIIFEEKKWRTKDIAKELNCTIYAATESRKLLFEKLNYSIKNLYLIKYR